MAADKIRSGLMATPKKGADEEAPDSEDPAADAYSEECEAAGQSLLDALDIKGDAGRVGQALEDIVRALMPRGKKD